MSGFTAGWNMPGYLPETDPVEFDTDSEALDYIRVELNSLVDSPDMRMESLESYQARQALRELDLENPTSWWVGLSGVPPVEVTAGQYVYWVVPAE
jgi:hypothetical protein